MKKITHFIVDGEYHSTQESDISFDWCIRGSEYKFLTGKKYVVREVDYIDGNALKVKVAYLVQVN